jgi:pimeloyl-ACP methyl ester carboxylesterase
VVNVSVVEHDAVSSWPVRLPPLDQPWPLPAWPDVPTRVLTGRHDRMFPLEFQRRIARERLGLEVDEIDGGHMVAMSHPRHWPTAWRYIGSRSRTSGEMPGNEHDAQQTRLGRAVHPPGATRRSARWP